MSASPNSPQSTPNPRPSWRVNLLLIGGGIAFAIVLVVVILALFPGLIGGQDADRYTRDAAGTVMDVAFKLSDGDMFVFFPESIRPPDPDRVLYEYAIAWDSDGFRVPQQTADNYPIAAFGDSFTEAPVVPTPWVDLLAEMLDVPVRNYGYRGYGPEETAQAAEEFAGAEPRTWLLYAFFAGNDLNDTNKAQKIEERGPLLLLPFLLRQATENLSQPTPFPSDHHFDYPMGVIIGDKYYDFVPLDAFLWAQLAPPEGFAATRPYRIVGESLDRMAASVDENTCLAFIFIPTKEQIYYRYIHEGYRRWLRDRAERWQIGNDGTITLESAPVSEADEPQIIAQLTAQRDAMAELVESKPRWRFLDLLPAFEAAASNGEMLYFQYDTHWNMDGHQLAAQTIADFMQTQDDCSLQ